MSAQLLAVTVIGLVAGVILLVSALRSKPCTPSVKTLWIIALALMALSIAFRMFLLVGLVINGTALDVAPVAVGNLAVIAVFVAAFRQPAWAGWALIASAAVMPLMTWILSIIGAVPGPAEVAGPMLGFYSLPAIVTGVLLLLSTHQWKTAGLTSSTPAEGAR